MRIFLVSLISAIVSIALLLSNKQFKISFIYGGLLLLLWHTLRKDMYTLPTLINTISVLLNALILRLFPIFMLGYYVVMSTKKRVYSSHGKVENSPMHLLFQQQLHSGLFQL